MLQRQPRLLVQLPQNLFARVLRLDVNFFVLHTSLIEPLQRLLACRALIIAIYFRHTFLKPIIHPPAKNYYAHHPRCFFGRHRISKPAFRTSAYRFIRRNLRLLSEFAWQTRRGQLTDRRTAYAGAPIGRRLYSLNVSFIWKCFEKKIYFSQKIKFRIIKNGTK